MALPKVTIYTDGACSPNPGVGGWAAVLLKDGVLYQELSGREEKTTNNRMELAAALHGLLSLKEPHRVIVITDSTYVKNGICSWMNAWKRRGWLTAARQQVKNRDLWKQLDKAIGNHQVDWQWVRGHSEDFWNERADDLAVAARNLRTRDQAGVVELAKPDNAAIAVFCGITYAPSRKVGSWAVILSYRRYMKVLGGTGRGDSANQFHLQSLIAALSALKKDVPVTVYTTSGYLRDGVHSWLAGWQQRGWMTSQGKEVGNRDLWQRLAVLVGRFSVDVQVVTRENGFCLLQEAKELAREWRSRSAANSDRE